MFIYGTTAVILSLISTAAQAGEAAVAVPPLTALVLLTLLASLTVHLWQCPDVLQSRYRKPVLLLALGSFAVTLLWSAFSPGHPGVSVLGYAAILTATLFTLNYWIRQAELQSVKRLLQELADQQDNLLPPETAGQASLQRHTPGDSQRQSTQSDPVTVVLKPVTKPRVPSRQH